MEDRHVLAALHPEHGVAQGQAAVTPQQAVSLAGVFDGHAGDATATYAARHLPQLVHSAISGQRASPGETHRCCLAATKHSVLQNPEH
jgi:serine/threonine protein phosphatase PrpC